MPQGLTLEQLQQMGGKPAQGQGLSLQQLQQMQNQPTQDQQPSQPKGILGNLALGAGKGLISTATNLGSLALKGASSIPFLSDSTKRLFQESAQTGQDFVKNQLSADNASQQVGKTAEQVGEFFVPGGAEEELYAKGASHIDQLPKILGLGEKAGGALTNSLKIALKSGISGYSMAGVTAAQGGSTKDIKDAGLLGETVGGIGKALEIFGPGLAQSIVKSGFKLSPSQEAKAASKIEGASKFITDNKILGLESTKYTKLAKVNSDLEEVLQSSLPKNVLVPKSEVIKNITDTVASLKNTDPAIYNQANRDAQEAIELLQSKPGSGLKVTDALDSKRSYGTSAFRTSQYSVKDPRVVSDGAYAIEQGFQKALQDTLDKTKSVIKIPEKYLDMFGGKTEVSLKEFNRVYSNAISAKNLTNIARFKNDTGLVGRLFGLWAGESLGQTIAPGLPGKIIGGATGEILSNKVPSLARNVLERGLLSDHTAVPAATKVFLGAKKKGQ